MIEIADFVASWTSYPFARHGLQPWDVTSRSVELIQEALSELGEGYARKGDVAVHASAIVEPGAIVKGPAILGPGSFVAATAYLRGGVFVGRDCIVGPGCESKSTFMLEGSKVAHLNFVGDTIIGARSNIEAGAMVANYRNELAHKRIRILRRGAIVDSGVDKFGALIGDDAVVAPAPSSSLA